jgi:hypothetical protein
VSDLRHIPAQGLGTDQQSIELQNVALLIGRKQDEACFEQRAFDTKTPLGRPDDRLGLDLDVDHPRCSEHAGTAANDFERHALRVDPQCDRASVQLLGREQLVEANRGDLDDRR